MSNDYPEYFRRQQWEQMKGRDKMNEERNERDIEPGTRSYRSSGADMMLPLFSRKTHPAVFGQNMQRERKTKGYHRRMVNGRSNGGGK